MSSNTTTREPAKQPATLGGTTAPNDNKINEKHDSDDIKRPAQDSADVEGHHKRPRIDANDEDDDEVVDMAIKVGLKPGDRVQVQWDLTEDFSGDVETRWWGATLLEHDGRLVDKAAIRVLDYDPYLAGGFSERSREDVCFVDGECLLSNLGPTMEEGQVMRWRREGEEATYVLDEEGLREELNGMLLSLTSKHSSLFQRLDAATQAKVAEKIAKGKEDLLKAIRKRWQESDRIISSADMQSILAETFGDLPAT